MKHDNDPIAACDRIVEEMPQRPGIRYGGDKALYRPWTDQVHMPRRETFISSEAYYGVLIPRVDAQHRTPGAAQP